MNFLAIDTSSSTLNVAVYRDGRVFSRVFRGAYRHSVSLMGEIDAALKEANASLVDCDFIACVVGPGSFTGIRIGVSTVKGLCMAAEKPALAVTSFDVLAYAEKREERPSLQGLSRLTLVDAGHDNVYACPYRGGEAGVPVFLSREEAVRSNADCVPVTEDDVDTLSGLVNACLKRAGSVAPADALAPFYMRKSSAEEKR